MSKYTTEVRFICESIAGLRVSQGANNVDNIITMAMDKIFDFDFPIFDENYRPVLKRKILKHFYTREIGEESYGLWKLRMNTRLNEIMPYYNKLYESELLEFNPLYSHEMHTNRSIKADGNGTINGSGNSSGSNSNTGSSLNTYSDTPQGTVQNLEDETYLTNARKVSETTGGTFFNESTNRSDNETHNTETYLEDVVGYAGVNASKRLLDYRKTFLNIDMEIINNLEDLFMQLW